MGHIGEKASKFNHQFIINDKNVQSYLKRCYIPDVEHLSKIDFKDFSIDFNTVSDLVESEIEKIIVIDGGYQIITIKDNYPSAQIAYYSVGLLTFDRNLLKDLDTQQTIDPNDVGKLKNLHKFHFVLPVKIIKFKDKTFSKSIRETIFNTFNENYVIDNDKKTSLLNTVKWLTFKEYHNDESKGSGSFEIACPSCKKFGIKFSKKSNYDDPINDFISCPHCNEIVYFTDIFSLHELVDDFNGASGIVSYFMSVFEVILMLSIFKYAHENKRATLLSKSLFIKDGSLALYSRLDDFSYKVVRPFIQSLYIASLKKKKSYINIVGLEKSGMFIEHLSNMEDKIPNNTLIIPNLNYMKKYITGETSSVFGENTYFGTKMIYKYDESLSFVVDMPLPCVGEDNICLSYKEYIKNPKVTDFLNLKTIITILCELRCDMYNRSFIPVTLINKLVSLSDMPSSKILTIFTTETLTQ